VNIISYNLHNNQTGRFCYYFHFIDEYIQVQEDNQLAYEQIIKNGGAGN
jgi:hypothetical protein